MSITSFNPPQRTLMGPGPSDVSQRVLSALGRPTIGHLDPEFVNMMDEVKQLLQYAFKTNNSNTMAISAPGSAGMEACFVNLIEPQDRLKSELERMENQKIIYKNLLLGRQDDAIVDFYISGTSSSILKFDSSTPVKRKTTSMDTLCKNINISKIDLLKLDVQGYELEILKGAKNVLKRTSLIITEVSLIDVYENCPLVSEIVKYLDTRDFQLFDIADFRRRELDNSLWQCDMFFIRKDNHILFDKRKDKKHQRPK